MQRSHGTYSASVVQYLRLWGPEADATKVLVDHAETLLALLLLDLEPARAGLEACYSQRPGGRRHRDPVCMLRAVILMGMLGVTGFNKWAPLLGSNRAYAVLAGFAPDDTPGIGTFYDFCARVLDGPKPFVPGYSPPSRRNIKNRGKFRRVLKQEQRDAKAASQATLAAQSDSPTRAAVDAALTAIGEPIARDFITRINEILMACTVVPSAARGLLGNVRQLLVAGDGSALPTHASFGGKPTCDCRRRGIRKCECERIYTDPTARWGYDSHEERFFFGHRLHALVNHHDHRDLPLFLSADTANVADVLMGVRDLTTLHKLMSVHLPGAGFGHVPLDAGYDATAMYRLVCDLGGVPIIALNERNFRPNDAKGIERDADGCPLCPGGAKMRFHVYNKRTRKTVFNCPAKRPTRKNGKIYFKTDPSRCPRGSLCEPNSVMGPLLNLATEDDPRLNPPIPRCSEVFKSAYSHRTCAERFFSFSTVARNLGRRPYRRQHLFLIAALGHAMELHARAWVHQTHGDTLPRTYDELLAALTALQRDHDTAARAA